jgi:hypothetical protein
MGNLDCLRFHALENALKRGWDDKRDCQSLNCPSEAQAGKIVAWQKQTDGFENPIR